MINLEPTIVHPTALPVAEAHLAELRAEAERIRLARTAGRPAEGASRSAAVATVLRQWLARPSSVTRREPCPTC